MLDSYDEMPIEFRYKNLYTVNNLEEWGCPMVTGYPKIIITCRQEFLEA